VSFLDYPAMRLLAIAVSLMLDVYFTGTELLSRDLVEVMSACKFSSTDKLPTDKCISMLPATVIPAMP